MEQTTTHDDRLPFPEIVEERREKSPLVRRLEREWDKIEYPDEETYEDDYASY